MVSDYVIMFYAVKCVVKVNYMNLCTLYVYSLYDYSSDFPVRHG